MKIIIAQLIGGFGLINTILSNHQIKKDKVLIFQILANFLYCLQYILLKAFSAATMVFIGIIRCIIFYYYDKKQKKKSVLVLLVFFVIILISGILCYDDIFCLIPIIASMLYAYGVWQDNMKIFRIIALIMPFAWIIYNTHVCAYIGVISGVIEAFFTIGAIIKLDIKKEKREL